MNLQAHVFDQLQHAGFFLSQAHRFCRSSLLIRQIKHCCAVCCYVVFVNPVTMTCSMDNQDKTKTKCHNGCPLIDESGKFHSKQHIAVFVFFRRLNLLGFTASDSSHYVCLVRCISGREYVFDNLVRGGVAFKATKSLLSVQYADYRVETAIYIRDGLASQVSSVPCQFR